MKVLLSEKNQTVFKKIYDHLLQLDFNVIVPPIGTSVSTCLSQVPGIQILILGETEESASSQVAQIRKDHPFLYIFSLLKVKDDSNATKLLRTGADECLFADEISENFGLRLSSMRRILQKPQQSSFYELASDQKGIKQDLNLEMALQYVNQENSLLKELLEILITSVKELVESPTVFQRVQWEELHQNSEAFGTEKLADQIKSLLSHSVQYQEYFKQNREKFYLQINRTLRELKEVVKCLDDFHFFKNESQKKKEFPLENARILLVEDMLHNRILVKQILKKHNAKVVEVTNGEEAVEYWEQKGADLIIMDMNMPVMDGFTATAIIREKEEKRDLKKTPILALTALAMKGDKEHCLEVGCDSYLPKPVESQALLKIAGQLISETDPPPETENLAPSIQFQKVLVKTKNQVYRFCLKSVLKEVGIDYEFLVDQQDVITALDHNDFDLVILDLSLDLELAYYLKEKYEQIHIVFIATQPHLENSRLSKLQIHLDFPFHPSQVIQSLHEFSMKYMLRKKKAAIVADMISIANVDSQGTVDECVNKSDGQLSVWQKSLGKIGGDLVLSHNFNLHGKFGFILADVSGHDALSGYTASWFSGLVKGLWGQFAQPVDLLINLNNMFEHETSEEDKRYVCALVLLWDRVRSKLYYANAGIPGGILLKRDQGTNEMINWKGMPIGMFPNMDMFDHGVIDLSIGDRLYMATDGVLENIPNEVVLGLGEEQKSQSVEDALDSVVDFIKRSIEIKDDLTIAVFDAHPLHPIENGFRATISTDLIEVDHAMGKIEKFIQENFPGKYDWAMNSIAIKEAFINAVEHGNKKNKALLIDYDVEILDDLLQITISDSGGGFDLSSVKKRLKLEGQLRVSGRGIDLMEHIAYQTEFVGGGVRLMFSPV